MSLFWNKRIEADKIIYSRTKEQKRLGYLFIIIGFLLMIGLPTLIKNSNYFQGLSQQWPNLFLVLIFLGVALIIFTAIFISTVNFKLANAKRKGKKFQIVSTNESDTVEIQN